MSDAGFDRLAFVDEYGDPNLEVTLPGVSNHFIVTAVVLEPSNRDALTGVVRSASQDFFSGSEVKSSSVGRDDARRIRILTRLADADYVVHAVAVDKRRIRGTSGLINREPFVKFMHGMLCRQLFTAHPRVEVTADRYGSTQFMDGFREYVRRNHYQRDLFSQYSFAFVPSDSEPLIQLADFIAGSLARVFDPQKMTRNAQRILDILNDRLVHVMHWPLRQRAFAQPVRLLSPEDDKVRSFSQRAAFRYLEEHYDTRNGDIALRAELLQFLLYRLQYAPEEGYAPAHDLLEALAERTGVEIDQNHMRAELIGPLRDAAVLLVSTSGTGGYKLAASVADLKHFSEEVDRRVTPQLRRLGVMRQAVRSATLGSVDILEGEYAYLATAIEAVAESA